MKQNYVVLCPYFGRLPDNIEVFFQSCGNNKKIKFIIITDDKHSFKYPNNVELLSMEFDELKSHIQSKFNFKISLDNPYKLCDYRPAFGYIFKDLTRGFDYWGYCDLDMIFGDLQKYLPTKKYDKISRLGPFCLYRNIKRVNEAFMLNGNCKFNYKGIFSSNVHFAFDEIGKYGINSIFDKYGYSIYDYQNNAADLNCILEGMNITSGHSGNYTTSIGKRVFEFNKGKIFGYLLNGNSILKSEYAYIHFQKRKMNLDVNDSKKNCIITHHLIANKNNQIIDIDYINNNQPKSKMLFRKWFKLKVRAVKVRVKRLFVIISNS